MGDRVSISFKKGSEESIALFDHWGGTKRVEDAEAYVTALKAEVDGSDRFPLDRLQPSTVMVDYIRHATTGLSRVHSSLYVGRDSKDGDNSDNGHHVIKLD